MGRHFLIRSLLYLGAHGGSAITSLEMVDIMRQASRQHACTWIRLKLRYMEGFHLNLNLLAVPLYDSLGESAVEYTVNHSATALVFVQASKLALLAKAVPKVKGSLHAVVVWGGSDAAAEAAVKKEVQT